MAIREICFIIPLPLMKRDYDRLGVERFRARGYQVSFLDVTFLLNPEVMERGLIQPWAYEHVCVVKSPADIEQFFAERKARRWFLVDFVGRPETEPLLEKYLKDNNVIHGNFCANSIPKVRYQPLWRMALSRRSWQRLTERLQKKFLSTRSGSVPARFVTAGGLYDQHKFPKTDERTRIIWAHTLDYDLYLAHQQRREKPLVEGDYVVFLDEGWPFHPDFHLTDGPQNPFRSPEEYYDEVNRLLKIIEQKLQLKVVIAAHPKAPYENMPNLFEGRMVLKGKTVDLVAHAKCVLCHGSASMNFAVMFRKPLIFLLPMKVKGQFYGRVIAAAAKQFAQIPQDVRSIENLDASTVSHIDEDKYRQYEETFIKRTSTPRKFYADIVADAFDKIVPLEESTKKEYAAT